MLVLSMWLALLNKIRVDKGHASSDQKTLGSHLLSWEEIWNKAQSSNLGAIMVRLVAQARSPEWEPSLNLIHRLGQSCSWSSDLWANSWGFKSLTLWRGWLPWQKQLTHAHDRTMYYPKLGHLWGWGVIIIITWDKRLHPVPRTNQGIWSLWT